MFVEKKVNKEGKTEKKKRECEERSKRNGKGKEERKNSKWKNDETFW